MNFFIGNSTSALYVILIHSFDSIYVLQHTSDIFLFKYNL